MAFKRKSVNIDEVCDAMEDNNPEIEYWIDLKTGEMIFVTDYDEQSEREEIFEAIEYEPDRFREIPTISSDEAYSYMEEFIGQVKDENLREKLQIAIQGKGAFRRFQNVIAGDPEEEIKWFDYKDKRVKEETIEWLKSEGIQWEERYKTPTVEERISKKKQEIKEEIKNFVEKVSQIDYVIEIGLLGSIRRGKNVGADIDLAVFVKNDTDNINRLSKIYRKVYGSYHYYLDVFLLREDRTYLGHICFRKDCPTRSVDCTVQGCGDIKYLRQFQDFEFDERKFLKDGPLVLWHNPEYPMSIIGDWLKEISSA